MPSWGITFISLAYLGVLSLVATWARRKVSKHGVWGQQRFIYALSLGVYCTAWTYYGSVGHAARGGLDYLAIYLGPTLMMMLAPLLLRKTIRICRAQGIDTLPDFLAARFGKHPGLGALAVAITVVGIVPYIALQLKAIGLSAGLLSGQTPRLSFPFWRDPVFIALVALGIFILLFSGIYNNSRRHPGIVAVIAFESIIKLLAFAVLGLWVMFFLFESPVELFVNAHVHDVWQGLARLPSSETGRSGTWVSLLILSAMSCWLLPRQFLLGVSENTSEKHIPTATWLFPLYLLLINVLVIPIALAGMMKQGPGAEPDMFVLSLPLAFDAMPLTILVYLGGLSAATGMIIVSALSLGTAITNNFVVPLLSWEGKVLFRKARIWAPQLQHIRQASLLVVLLVSYIYYRLVGEHYTLVSTGLVSFAAIAQFFPITLAALYWKRATRQAATYALAVGAGLWFYTLVVPSFIETGWLPVSWLQEGPMGWSWLRPTALLGMEHLSIMAHGCFWSLFLNAATLVTISFYSQPTPVERNQAEIFVDVFRYSTVHEKPVIWKGTVYIQELEELLGHFLGREDAQREMLQFGRITGQPTTPQTKAAPQIVDLCEQRLAEMVGATSARILMATVVREDPITMEDVMNVLKETQHYVAYNRELRLQSQALKTATEDLQRANEKLLVMSTVKDEFISTVTHELRTPLTSIRAFAEILQDNPDLEDDERQSFLETLVRESERMSRLIEQVLDLERLENGGQSLQKSQESLNELIREVASESGHLVAEKQSMLHLQLQSTLPPAMIDRDRVKQVLINLISNAAKYIPESGGWVKILSYYIDEELKVQVIDNGPGIPHEELHRIFGKFHQIREGGAKKPPGSGLGLAIAQKLVEAHGGRIWASNQQGAGARFTFCLPCKTLPYYRRTRHVEKDSAGG